MDSIKEINNLNRTDFINYFGNIFEKSQWVAEVAFKNIPFENIEDLKREFISIFEGASSEKKIQVLNSHPELVVEKNLTEESNQEQHSADLKNCTKDEFDEFKNLNTKYKEKFGFPFVIAVSGKKKLEILEKFKKRVQNNKNDELNEAIEQVKAIAKIRLNQI